LGLGSRLQPRTRGEGLASPDYPLPEINSWQLRRSTLHCYSWQEMC